MRASRKWRRGWPWSCALALALIVGACAQPQQPTVVTPELVGAEATSSTSVLLTFEPAVGAGAELTGNYQIVGPGGAALAVLAAYPLGDGRQVLLATAPQQLVEYAVSVRGLGVAGASVAPGWQAKAGFKGSPVSSPVVARAVALTNTTVLVTFSDPDSGQLASMGDSAADPRSYRVSGPDLDVLGAAFAYPDQSRARVILTTSPMADAVYSVEATNVVSEVGNRLVDPFAAAGQFRGIAANDGVAPGVFEAYATSQTSVTIGFTEPVGGAAADPKSYVIVDPDANVVPVVAVELTLFDTEVKLTTWPLTPGVEYTVERIDGVTDKSGNALSLDPNALPTFTSALALPGADDEAPRVLGASSLSNTSVVVTFSEPVYGADDPARYKIFDLASVGSSGPAPQSVVIVEGAKVSANRRSVTLTTRAQSEILYALNVTGVADAAGNHIAPPDRDHPFQVTFMGTPVSGAAEDRDGDGLSDAAEQAGWTVTVTLANGQTTTVRVTSDPDVADTDGDGIDDGVERAYLMNPRSADSDNDDLSDYWELNHIYSDPVGQDSDADGLIDGLEWWFFRTSPNLADTDGDQILDGDEIQLGNRNPRLADLPLPGVEVGQVDLQLDVRFTATSSTSTRDLETRSVSSTLTQSERQATSNSDSNTQQFSISAGVDTAWKVGSDFGYKGSFKVETGYSGQWTSSFTRESARETQRAYSDSLETQAELQQGESVTREVQGASMRLSVNLRSLGDIAFNISNIQVTAFIQDPRNPALLRPIATLVPESEPSGGFNLGPIAPERGPLIFVANQIFPSLVEQLMRDPSGLVFKLANFDIVDEFGRNFAFTSQDVNDRTATVVIDYGAHDSDGDGEGDVTERLKVSTSGGLNPSDPLSDDDRVLFDLDGHQVGITLVDALENVLGLRHYDESVDPTSSLSEEQLLGSYSTIVKANREVLVRVRGVSRDLTDPLKKWVILTESGLAADDQDLLSVVLHAGEGVTLAFVQDLDDDGIPARVEYLLGCDDRNVDTDGDGLTDRQEVYEGWQINVRGRDGYRAYSSCARADSDLDGIPDKDEVSRVDSGGNPVPTDPKRIDTDGDGLSDSLELTGVTIDVLFGSVVTVTTDPLDPDTDGDTLPDGAERDLRTDPTVNDGDKVLDDDRDGLVNFLEDQVGWSVSYFGVSATPLQQGTSTPVGNVKSLRNDPDSDNDGLNDLAEFQLKTDPTKADTDGDGLTDAQEVAAGTDPLDADTDDDLRSDGAEVNVGLVIKVVGEDQYVVFSDPLVADADHDGWVDGEEADPSRGTDPTKVDTDGDGGGKNDKEEGGTCVGTGASQVCRDPLAPDQRLTVRFTLNVDLDGDLDPLGGTGDFKHTLTIERGDGTSLVQDSEVFLNNNSTSFIWTPQLIRPLSESLTIDIVVYESDSGTADDGERCRLDDRKDIGGIPGVVNASQNYTTQTVNDFVGDPIAECKFSMSVGFQAD